MHLGTYTLADAGAMLAHYERRIGPREHIDPVGRVYNAAPELGGPQARFRELCEGLEIGARTRPLADLIVTLPKGCEIPQEDFFDAAYQILRNTIGEYRVVSAYVHLDEPGAQPHMHFSFVPIIHCPVMTNDKTRPLLWTAEDQEKNPEHVAGTQKTDSKGTPRWERVPARGEDGQPVMRRTASASKVLSRQAMRQLHPSMEKALCKHFGVERVGITLDAQDARRTLSKLDHREYVEATKEIDRTKQELGQVREQVTEAKTGLQQATKQVTEKQAEVNRLERLRQGKEAENSGLDQRIRELEAKLERSEQQPSEELEREQQPEAQEPAEEPEPEKPKLGHELLETAKLTAAAGLGGARSIEEQQRSEAATARDLDQRISDLEDAKRDEGSLHDDEVRKLGEALEGAEGRFRGIEGEHSQLQSRAEELESRLNGLVERFVGRLHELSQTLGLERACERVGTWLCERQDDLGTRLFDAKYEFRDRFGDLAERFFDEWGRLKTRFDLEYERETGDWPAPQSQQTLAEAAEVARGESQHIERAHYGIDDIMRDIERAEQARGFDDDDGSGLMREIPARELDYDRGLER